MTYKEALQILNGDREGYFVEALSVAKQALLDQIPIKPKTEELYGWHGELNGYAHYCKRCGNDVGTYERAVPYCPYCGQAIDWDIDWSEAE